SSTRKPRSSKASPARHPEKTRPRGGFFVPRGSPPRGRPNAGTYPKRRHHAAGARRAMRGSGGGELVGAQPRGEVLEDLDAARFRLGTPFAQMLRQPLVAHVGAAPEPREALAEFVHGVERGVVGK